MNKEELIAEVAKITCTKAEAGKAVDALFEGVKKALKKGEKVTLVGFGTDPQGQEEIPRPANRSRSQPRKCPSLPPAKH